MNREACIGGCPTISICPDKLPGVDKLLIDKKIMYHSLDEKKIITLAEDILEDKGKYLKKKNGKVIKGFEDPYERIMSLIDNAHRK